MSEPATLPIPVQRPRRRRRWPFVLGGVLLVLVVLAAVGWVVGNRIVKQQAETQIASIVERNLPDGVTGRVTASVAGDWVLPQLWAGRFDHVTLRSQGLRVASAPASGVVQLYGLPVDSGTTTRMTAQLTVAQRAFHGLEALRQAGATDPVLGTDSVTTTVTKRIPVIDVPVKVRVTMTPTLSDQVVRLRTKDATLIAGPISVPATAIVNQLLPNGVDVCAAQYLPRPIELTSLQVEPRQVRVGIAAAGADLQQLDAARTGHC